MSAGAHGDGKWSWILWRCREAGAGSDLTASATAAKDVSGASDTVLIRKTLKLLENTTLLWLCLVLPSEILFSQDYFN